MARCAWCQALEPSPGRIVKRPHSKGPTLFFKRKAKEPELKPCPQCGEQIAATALDCPSCGLDLREAYRPTAQFARNSD